MAMELGRNGESGSLTELRGKQLGRIRELRSSLHLHLHGDFGFGFGRKEPDGAD